MSALPALARASRYGDVRGTDSGGLAEVAGRMVSRVCAGLARTVHNLGTYPRAEVVAAPL